MVARGISHCQMGKTGSIQIKGDIIEPEVSHFKQELTLKIKNSHFSIVALFCFANICLCQSNIATQNAIKLDILVPFPNDDFKLMIRRVLLFKIFIPPKKLTCFIHFFFFHFRNNAVQQ